MNIEDLYFKEIEKIPLLSSEEEIELAGKIQQGDGEALNKLVEANLKFVVKIAREYTGRGLSFFDLISEGNIGLIQAAERFDPKRGVKFISYAAWWIRQSMMEAICKQVKLIRLPYNRERELIKIIRYLNKFPRHLDHPLGLEEMAEDLQIPLKQVEKVLNVSRPSLSLEATLEDYGQDCLKDIIQSSRCGDPGEELKRKVLGGYIKKLLRKLPYRERTILEFRFGLKDGNAATLEETGRRLGLTKQRIQKLESQAIHQLRKEFKRGNFIQALSEVLDSNDNESKKGIQFA